MKKSNYFTRKKDPQDCHFLIRTIWNFLIYRRYVKTLDRQNIEELRAKIRRFGFNGGVELFEFEYETTKRSQQRLLESKMRRLAESGLNMTLEEFIELDNLKLKQIREEMREREIQKWSRRPKLVKPEESFNIDISHVKGVMGIDRVYTREKIKEDNNTNTNTRDINDIIDDIF